MSLSILISLLFSLVAAVSYASTEPAQVIPQVGAATEQHLPADVAYDQWVVDTTVFDEDQGDVVEMHEMLAADIKTVKLTDLVPAIHFRLGEAVIPDDSIEQLRSILQRMRERENVRLHFVGHADSLPLSGELQAIFGDNLGLSRERAGTTAEYFQQALGLPPEAISYEGLGDQKPVADNTTEAGRALNRRVEVEVWYDEIGTKAVQQEVIVAREVNRIKVCRVEDVCKLRYRDGHAHRARVKNLVAPLRYREGIQDLPDSFLTQIRQAHNNLSAKQNVVARFIAYTDDTPLVGRDKRIYENLLGYSGAVARRVAVGVQEALGWNVADIESVGNGTSRPVASNETPRGRALNRRVEVEFWYDDPLQELPDEPQICPDAAGAETVTRVYHPPAGDVPPVLFSNGNPDVPPATMDRLRQILAETGDKANVRLRFIGYIRNQRLDRRVANIYGDDIGWSTARARRTMEMVREQMGLAADQVEFEGRGYVQSEDVINAGFVESGISRVEIQAVYDERLPLDSYDGVIIEPLTREASLTDPFALNLMRISVDGEPIDDPRKSIPDMQRCTDLALQQARVRFSHDNLALEPRLNVTAWPRTVAYDDDPSTERIENQVDFRYYSNYRSFIDRAEVLLFHQGQSLRDEPVALISLGPDGSGRWTVSSDAARDGNGRLKYLVRVYDRQGRYDETVPQALWLVDQLKDETDPVNRSTELLAGYGESRISRQDIPLHGGTVQARGESVPTDHQVWLAGYPVPVDQDGRFIAEEILPDGLHTVEVAVLDQAGNGELFLRDLELPRNDWFTVGIADLTLSANETNGPADLLAPDKPEYSDDLNLHGRLAFYTKGKFGRDWSLIASADTREGPLDDIFSNFLEKSPDALLRRIDPAAHYPTFGDDSSLVEDAPTHGKFYLKLEQHENHALWGNYKVAYLKNRLAHIDRGLYGLNLHYQSDDYTKFGEQRFAADGFAADPGTVAGRDEFRGTGGSLYYLQRQDILTGSERLRIEVRDKDSGLVTAVRNLTPVLDYDIDYLQGRILLAQPLSAVADDELLVRERSLSGHDLVLVARYEYTPGFDKPDLLATGGRFDYWVNDHVKLGVTGGSNETDGDQGTLGAVDVTLRKTPATWIKLEAGRSEGPGLAEVDSGDGGFQFTTTENPGEEGETANAYRVDMSLDIGDVFARGRGRVTLYGQQLEAGYAAPGLLTAIERTQFGGTATIPVAETLELKIKADKEEHKGQLETSTAEFNLAYSLRPGWTLSSGVRYDDRRDSSAAATFEQGERTDGVVQLQYAQGSDWSLFGFAQDSLSRDDERAENSRFGLGGDFRITDRLMLDAEVSDGDMGAAARLGTEFLYSDRSTLYLNYTHENEHTDNGLGGRKGAIVSGVRSRYSDSASIYLEERYDYGDIPTGLMHSAGISLTPMDRLNIDTSIDFGTLKDRRTQAETERTAAAVQIGYGIDRVKFFSAVEYRLDESTQVDGSSSDRTTWLFRNNLKYKTTPSWNFIGKLDYSFSDSSLGELYDGKFIEAVLGYAYRPVINDRLNALIKYTYFYDLPAAEQLTAEGETSTVLQKSHIAALELMYELTQRWSVGGKYAYRQGEISLDRVNPEFFTSRAHLYVVRADWNLLHRWDALVEGRLLDLPDAEDRRNGALLALYRHFGNHVKLGVGYNFSDFSDDLTQLDYDHQGLFVNLIGKY